MIPSHFIRPARRFRELEAASGLVLLGATAIALNGLTDVAGMNGCLSSSVMRYDTGKL